MDEDRYRELYDAYNQRRCLYEKAILSTHCSCRRMRKLLLAEREAAACESKAGQQRCQAFLQTLRQASRFALKHTDAGSRLPHAPALRLQVGGLQGLHQALYPNQPVPERIEDIDALLEQAETWPGGFEQLPFQRILPVMNRFEGRRPKRRRRR